MLFAKVTHNDNFELVGKIMQCFFQVIKKKGKWKTSPSAFKKKPLPCCLRIFDNLYFFIKLEKVNKLLTFQDFFLEKHNFPESGPGIGVCIVHVVIFINLF